MAGIFVIKNLNIAIATIKNIKLLGLQFKQHFY